MIEAIGALKTSLEVATTIAKTVKDINRAVDEATYKAQLAELLLALSETHINISELNNVLIEKDTQISNLQNQLSIQENLTYKDPVYWLNQVSGQTDGPFCQKCYDDNKKLVRLPTFNSTKDGAWTCSVCNTFFSTKDYDEATNRELEQANRGSNGWV